jgi:NAD(P)H-hydrate epimerase
LGQIPDLKHDALLNFNRLVATGVPVQFLNQSSAELPEEAPDLIIDAILGTGTKGDLEGLINKIVHQINYWKMSFGSSIIAVDIPSGLNGETGYVGNTAVLADATITFGLPKQGLIFGEGKKYSGELIISDIGLPESLVTGGERLLIEREDIRVLFKPRNPNAYKYQYGKALVVAGSRVMSGAALLTASAVLRSGAGMLKVAIPEGIAHVIENRLPEAMTVALPQTTSGSLSSKAMDSMKELIDWCDVMAVGPGISRNEETQGFICELIRVAGKPAVIDADAIIALSGCKDDLRANDTPMVFTPHIGEFSVLAGIESSAVNDNRMFHLIQTVRKLRKTILLKGSPTFIAGPNSPLWISNHGNPGMATAGCGDVLTGIITGFMAQGLSCDEAAYAGAWIHGLAGDLAAKEKTQYGLIAGDLIDYLPAAFRMALYVNRNER